MHLLLEGSTEAPLVVRRVVVVRRHEHGEAGLLRGGQQLLEVLDRVVLGDALADELPRGAVLAEEVVLGVGDDEGGVMGVDLHLHAPWVGR